jgi:alkanesulfonate monooxygenase SsuD/methylene tetrahydromethanopterin reductase-like flavin-dependent oxidoreductase (luciferase family)
VRFGVYVPTFGEYDVPTLAELARESEAAGWDGFFIWDHLLWSPGGRGLADTTVALTAIALATERVRFGALVSALARRRPWKFAKETATLDRLSGGRLVVGVGLGASSDIHPVGEEGDARHVAEVLDEGLELLQALWSGTPVTHRGRHFTLDAAQILPAPLQLPRIPIWVAGFWPSRAPFRRAARWDGALPLKRGHLLEELSPEELRRCSEYLHEQRSANAPFDLIAFSTSMRRDPQLVAAREEAGASWWLESVNPLSESLRDFRSRVIRHGPPS